MLRSAVLALALVSTPAFAKISVSTDAEPVPAPLVKKIRGIIAERAVDPQSVMIRDARVVHVQLGDKPLLLVCGRYNAKNRMGGYAASADFVYETSFLKGVLTLNLEQRQIAFFSETADRPDFDGSPEGVQRAVRMGYGDRFEQDSQVYLGFAQTLFPYCLGQNG